MAIVIVVVTVILYIVLLGFTWHNLNTADSKVKILYILVSIIIMWGITLITFNISTNGIEYENKNMISSVRNILVAVFTPINGLIVMPYLANALSKIKLDEITQSELKTKSIILAIILLIVLVFECSYLKNIQLGILNIISNI